MKRLTNAEVRVDASVDGMIGPLVDLTNLKPKLLNMILNGPTLNGVSKDVLRQIIRQLYSELAAHEDTGLEPEEVDKLTKDWSDLCTIVGECGGISRVRELAEADKDGRLVVLPCKVGDTVYEVTSRKTISEYRVKAIRTELFCAFIEWDITAGFVDKSIFGVPVNEIGKTVFLTREEAEKALEAMK